MEQSEENTDSPRLPKSIPQITPGPGNDIYLFYKICIIKCVQACMHACLDKCARVFFK